MDFGSALKRLFEGVTQQPQRPQQPQARQQPYAPPSEVRYPRVNPQTGYRSMQPNEESVDLYGTSQLGPNGRIPDHISAYREPGIQSIGGKFGSYGGTVGLDNGKLFANMNREGTPTDPLTELRRRIGF